MVLCIREVCGSGCSGPVGTGNTNGAFQFVSTSKDHMDYIIGNVESATAIGILDDFQLLNDEGKKETVAILEYVNHKK